MAKAVSAGTTGSGTSTADAAAKWPYTANDSQAAIQQLGAGQSITDSFTAVSSDGSNSQLVTVTIHGTNNVTAEEHTSALHSPRHIVSRLLLANKLTTGGALTIADRESRQSHFAV